MAYFKYIILVIVLGIICWSGLPSIAGEQNLDITINSSNQVLSVCIENTSLSIVLKEIEKKSGCKIHLFSSQDDKITDSFSDLPLNQGIQRLAKNYSLALIYQIADTSVGTKKIQKIKEAWLFEGNNTSNNNSSLVSNKNEAEQSTLDIKGESITEKSNTPQLFKETQLLKPESFDDHTNVGFWANRLFEAQEVDDKKQSITELQRIDSDESVAVITTVLGDKDIVLRQHAAECLKVMDNKGASQILAQILLGDPAASVRKTALGYFIGRKDEVSYAFLNTALQDKNVHIQKLAAKALKEF
ncbi:MAG: HEAT repeat domain-containing protein [Desulfobacteraceae bacterium]|nr:HEAT repeat domain-containing protein [Desulfobacteraceae bacterium]